MNKLKDLLKNKKFSLAAGILVLMLLAFTGGYFITDNLLFGEINKLNKQYTESMHNKDFRKAFECATKMYSINPTKQNEAKLKEITEIINHLDNFIKAKELISEKKYVEAASILNRINKAYVDETEYNNLYLECKTYITKQDLLNRLDRALDLALSKDYEKSLQELNVLMYTDFEDVNEKAKTEFTRIKSEYDTYRYNNALSLINKNKFDDARIELEKLIMEDGYTLVDKATKAIEELEQKRAAYLKEQEYKAIYDYTSSLDKTFSLKINKIEWLDTISDVDGTLKLPKGLKALRLTVTLKNISSMKLSFETNKFYIINEGETYEIDDVTYKYIDATVTVNPNKEKL